MWNRNKLTDLDGLEPYLRSGTEPRESVFLFQQRSRRNVVFFVNVRLGWIIVPRSQRWFWAMRAVATSSLASARPFTEEEEEGGGSTSQLLPDQHPQPQGSERRSLPLIRPVTPISAAEHLSLSQADPTFGFLSVFLLWAFFNLYFGFATCQRAGTVKLC